MIKHFIIYSSLATLILSSYLPMSQKKHNFGSNICRYYDGEDKIDYVRPCDTDKYCQETETHSSGANSRNRLYTCQKYIEEIPPNPSDPLKDRNEVCEDSSECGYGLSCLESGTTKKCDLKCSTGQTLFKIDDYYYCRYVDNKCRYTKDDFTYKYNPRNCKVCGKITSQRKTDNNNKEYYVVDYADEVEPFSQPDGTYVIDIEACQSATALYFYLDGKIKNEIDNANSNKNKLYYKCVSIKAVDYNNKRFNYTEGTDKVYIYEISELELDSDGTTKKNDLNDLCNQYKMTKIELWNNNREEYIKKLACPDENNFDDNFKRKLYYLEHPEQYLLYKDQTEVIEYLIQKEYPGIVPIKTTAGYLSSKYIILSLILLFL